MKLYFFITLSSEVSIRAQEILPDLGMNRPLSQNRNSNLQVHTKPLFNQIDTIFHKITAIHSECRIHKQAKLQYTACIKI